LRLWLLPDASLAEEIGKGMINLIQPLGEGLIVMVNHTVSLQAQVEIPLPGAGAKGSRKTKLHELILG
jgi:hypothetical protein